MEIEDVRRNGVNWI